MAVMYKVENSVLHWAVKASGIDFLVLSEKLPKLSKWLENSTEISLPNIQKLSTVLHIPFGYFFLSEPPNEEIDLVNYRTIDNVSADVISRNLIDTIYDMERKQEFIRESRINDGFMPLPFIKKFSIDDNYLKVANDIRNKLKLDIDWNLKAKNAFLFLRYKLSNTGISVFKNGVVNTNTKRILDVNEFRAFVLIDEYAPLIFINNNDSNTAQLFSLCHETVHIWLGEPELLNTFGYEVEANKKEIERFCNKVAGELLVPKEQINKLFNNDYSLNNVILISNKLKISPQVTLIALKQNLFLSTDEFDKLYIQILEYTEERPKKQKKNSGGNYYNTALSRLDNNFIALVNAKATSGDILYTEAFDLLNVKKGKTYDQIIEKAGIPL